VNKLYRASVAGGTVLAIGLIFSNRDANRQEYRNILSDIDRAKSVIFTADHPCPTRIYGVEPCRQSRDNAVAEDNKLGNSKLYDNRKTCKEAHGDDCKNLGTPGKPHYGPAHIMGWQVAIDPETRGLSVGKSVVLFATRDNGVLIRWDGKKFLAPR